MAAPWFALAAIVAGCDQGAKPAPAAQSRETVAAPGLIRGVVTFTMNGPGREHSPEESFSETTPLQCNVAVRDAWGPTLHVATSDKGAYEVKVPVGRYTVSFEACTDSYCNGPEHKTMTVEVVANEAVEASFDCEVDAK
jgi:hypothetical protein